jgi:hypothetical protein
VEPGAVTAFAVWLLAVAVGDLVAGSGGRTSRRRSWLAVAVAVTVAVASVVVTPVDAGDGVVVVAAVAVTVTPWVLTRHMALRSARGAAVTLVLCAVGTVRVATAGRDASPPDVLRGGRAIGCLERGLILGFALAGEPTAAALVISGKSLLRFPEATRSDVNECFVVGSLASWSLALAPLVLLA